VSRKVNEAFFEEYKALDNICCRKFGTDKSGVTEYITRLNNARFAPMRDEVLPRLVKYRNIRNSIAHDEGALYEITDIIKSDVKWIKYFIKLLEKKKDPLSLYLRKARRHAKLRRARKVILIAFLCIALAAGAAVAVITLI
jgi:adenine-specific DNA methylase